MIFLAGIEDMSQRRLITIYLQLESVESVGHRKRRNERNIKIGKEKLSA
jgi:hypothetical protein